MWLWESRNGQGRIFLNPLDFKDFSERNRSFDDTGGLCPARACRSATPTARAERVPTLAVTTRFFDVFGVPPIAGRTFQRADEGPQPSAVVLGEAFWRRRFGGDRSVVGSELRLDGRPFTVVGIVPASFRFDLGALDTAMWTLLNTPVNSGPSQRYPITCKRLAGCSPA